MRETRSQGRSDRAKPAGEPSQKSRYAFTARAPVPQTDAGGPVEHTEAIGRTVAKELGKTAP